MAKQKENTMQYVNQLSTPFIIYYPHLGLFSKPLSLYHRVIEFSIGIANLLLADKQLKPLSQRWYRSVPDEENSCLQLNINYNHNDNGDDDTVI